MSGAGNSAGIPNTGRPLRIAHIALAALPATVGGLEIVVDNLIRHQRELGHDASLVTRWRQAHAARAVGVAYPVRALPPFRSFARGPFQAVPPRLPVDLGLGWHAWCRRFDVLHAHWLFPTGWLAEPVARRLGIPLVATAHGADLQTDDATGYGYRRLPANEARLRSVAGRLGAAVAISPNLADRLEDVGVPRERIHRIPNGVDIARFAGAKRTRAETRARIGVGLEAKVLLAVGRNQPSKGLSLLPEVLSLLRRDGQDAICCIVGDGATGLSDQFAAAGLTDRVLLFEAMRPASGSLVFPPDDLVALYGAADVFVFPSLSEGAPLVALEAMAAGLPVVGADVQGIRDAIVHGETGLLCAPRDAAAMAQAVGRVLADPALAARLEADGKATAQAHDWSAIAARHCELYHGLLGGRAA